MPQVPSLVESHHTSHYSCCSSDTHGAMWRHRFCWLIPGQRQEKRFNIWYLHTFIYIYIYEYVHLRYLSSCIYDAHTLTCFQYVCTISRHRLEWISNILHFHFFFASIFYSLQFGDVLILLCRHHGFRGPGRVEVNWYMKHSRLPPGPGA